MESKDLNSRALLRIMTFATCSPTVKCASTRFTPILVSRCISDGFLCFSSVLQRHATHFIAHDLVKRSHDFSLFPPFRGLNAPVHEIRSKMTRKDDVIEGFERSHGQGHLEIDRHASVGLR